MLNLHSRGPVPLHNLIHPVQDPVPMEDDSVHITNETGFGPDMINHFILVHYILLYTYLS